MTNATKSLAIILVVLAVLTAGIKLSSGPEASQAFTSDIVEVDTSEVNRVVIEHPTNPTITLSKTDQQWQVSGKSGEGFPADGPGITRAIDRLNNLSVNAVATRNPEKFTRYKVDSTGTVVSLYNGQNLLSTVYVGAPQRQGRRSFNSYVRVGGQDAVYSVQGFLRPRFSKALDGWRDKLVWDVEQTNISSVDFLYPADSSFTMEKIGTRSWVSNGDTLSRSGVTTILSRLSSLNASGFPDAPTKQNFGTEKYAIQIQLSGGEQHRLRLKESPTDTTRYIGVTPDSPYVFNFRKNAWDNSVLKSRDDFLKDS